MDSVKENITVEESEQVYLEASLAKGMENKTSQKYVFTASEMTEIIILFQTDMILKKQSQLMRL